MKNPREQKTTNKNYEELKNKIFMPKSKTRTNKKAQAPGSNNHSGKRLRLEEMGQIEGAYRKKYVEYVAKDLKELIKLREQKTVKGTYLRVLTNVIEEKEIEIEKNKKQKSEKK